jgi:hypothetical protein
LRRGRAVQSVGGDKREFVCGDRGKSPPPGAKVRLSPRQAARRLPSTLTKHSKETQVKRVFSPSARVSASPYHLSKASKGTRGMPWRQVPMKDVVHCEKRWQVVCRRNNQRCPNGETQRDDLTLLRQEREPGELKHLINPRKREGFCE